MASKVDDYLIFVRNLIEYTLGDESRRSGGFAGRWKKNSKGEIIPLESDQQALNFLQLHGGDVAAAQLQLLSDLGVKKGKPVVLFLDGYGEVVVMDVACWIISSELPYFNALDTFLTSGANARGLESRDRTCLMGAYHSGVPGSGTSRDRINKYHYYFNRSMEDSNGDPLSVSSSSAGDNRYDKY